MPSQGVQNFDPGRDIPSLTGKVIFITGGTAGLGRESIQTLAAHSPAHIYFTGRNRAAGAEVAASIQNSHPDVGMTFIEADMKSLASVRAAATRFTHDRLDVLMCNAGIMAVPAELSKDGFEIHMAVNHLAHALLIRALLPVMRNTATSGGDVRIVIMTSTGPKGEQADSIPFEKLRTKMDGVGGSWMNYGYSKLANAAYARALAKRCPEITSVSIHPGIAATGLVTELPFWKRKIVSLSATLMRTKIKDPREGCFNQVWAVGVEKSKLVNGAMYLPVGVEVPVPAAKAKPTLELADKLWDWTQDVLSKV